MIKYDPAKIEKKWQKFWAENPSLDEASESSDKPKKYVLDMFPYPSGAGLHAGHVESYTATDIYSRYSRLKGFDVIHPQGWDAFGLPAENYAIKTGVHPTETTKQAIATFKRQMNSLGLSYDWSREVNSSDPEYYRWTQWFFLLLYKNGLAYKAKSNVNWCESCQTVLANEQAEGGICERCKNEVVQKDLEQWFFKITDFIETQGQTTGLLDGLDKIDWPESTKAAQKNWIGKSEGAQFKMTIKDSDKFLEVYTTRVDTVFGMTYVVVAPEHKLISELKAQIENYAEVEKYLIEAQSKTDLERMELKEKSGVELKGIQAVNPFNNQAVPVFVADYVLGHYGTGAVMAVPAHDERDFEFAKKYELPIIESISGGNIAEQAFCDDGAVVNSGKYDGLTSEEARQKMTEWLEQNNLGSRKINYRMRDWLVSRQRYWGAPIPIVYCAKCGEVPVPEADLPVSLPMIKDFTPKGKSPLAMSDEFMNVKCPKCGGEAKRESDTMDTFVCSSWYYFRYADPKNDQEFASKKQIEKWLPVDLYLGGAEHTVLHLLYSRFFTKALNRLGYISFDEPFLKLRHQGIILGEDGRKMSKSFGNVVNPDDYVKEFGADSLRMYEMFMGPLEAMKPWSSQGIIGVKRFLEKVYNLQEKVGDHSSTDNKSVALLHKTIKKVGEDIENFRFNTAISAMMILVNELEKQEKLPVASYQLLITILAPFAPHLSEDLWAKLGHKESIFLEKWPEFDPQLIQDEEIEMAVQFNGKTRGTITVSPEVSENEAKEKVLADEKLQKYLIDKEIRKVIFVKGRLINFVVSI
jgi:leucyl-tRNA synthetase